MNPPPPTPPVVLLPACHRTFGSRVFHATPETYSQALRLVGCLPLLVTSQDDAELAVLLEIADGVLLPGSPNNVHPCHFDEAILDPALPLDPGRDAMSLPLIRSAIERGIPLLGICRGHQEMNVALGGSLHQSVHRLPGRDNHQPFLQESMDRIYGPAHPISIEPGGLLERLVGSGPVTVNSVHGQAVNQIAPNMRVEAFAPDGTIEAISMPGAPGFNLGVQWHPEWNAAADPSSMAIFMAFAAACRKYQTARKIATSGP